MPLATAARDATCAPRRLGVGRRRRRATTRGRARGDDGDDGDDFDDGDGDGVARTGTRRALARHALALVVLDRAVTFADAARANALVDALNGTKTTQATFALGPVATSRTRLEAFRREVTSSADGIDRASVGARMTSVSLDCTAPRGSLAVYARGREVCTLAILARSATRGPAATNAPGSAEYDAVVAAMDDARVKFTELERALEDGEMRSANAAFDACDASLRAFAVALLACFKFNEDVNQRVRDAVPGAFA